MCDIEPGTTIKNPADPEQKYTFGKRGRRPVWVQEWLASQGFEKSVTSRKEVDSSPVERTEFQVWTYVNDGAHQNKCIIVARDIHHALRVASPTFSTPMFYSELEGDNWVEKPYDGELSPGIYQWDAVTDSWLMRSAKSATL